jgi:hypothetical protein
MCRFEMTDIRVQSPGGSQPFHLFRRREPELIGCTESWKIERLSPIAGLRQDQEARDLTDQPAQLRINASGSDHVTDDLLGQILIDRRLRARSLGTRITTRVVYGWNRVQQNIGTCRRH